MPRMVDQAYLAQFLSYDPGSGLLTWKERPRDMFSTERDQRAWNARFAGKPALNAINNLGYRVGLLAGVRLAAHRVAWIMATGQEPTVVDHINGDRSDNRQCNLQDGTQRQNMRNKRMSRGNRSGVTGVYWNAAEGKWRAQIRSDGIYRSKGFADLAEAARWRSEAQGAHGFSKRHGIAG